MLNILKYMYVKYVCTLPPNLVFRNQHFSSKISFMNVKKIDGKKELHDISVIQPVFLP